MIHYQNIPFVVKYFQNIPNVKTRMANKRPEKRLISKKTEKSDKKTIIDGEKSAELLKNGIFPHWRKNFRN